MAVYKYLTTLVVLSIAVAVQGSPTEKVVKRTGEIVEIPPVYLPTSQKKVLGTAVPEHIT